MGGTEYKINFSFLSKNDPLLDKIFTRQKTVWDSVDGVEIKFDW